MLDLFQLGVTTDDACKGLTPIVKIVRKGIFPIVQIGIPLILIVLGTIDLGKAVISSDDKEVKGAQSRLIKRCIYAVAIFFVTTLVIILMDLVAGAVGTDDPDIGNTSTWKECWEAAAK